MFFRRKHIRVFLASPGDVAKEREIVRKTIKNLPNDPQFRNRITTQIIAWEEMGGVGMDPMIPPQEAISRGLGRPSECDLVIVIFWARMGSPLPLDQYKKPDGSAYLSGTEWEYLDALRQSERTNGKRPIIRVYRRLEDPNIPATDSKRLQQKQLVDDFFAGFGGSRGWNGYDDVDDFRKKLQFNLREAVEPMIPRPLPIWAVLAGAGLLLAVIALAGVLLLQNTDDEDSTDDAAREAARITQFSTAIQQEAVVENLSNIVNLPRDLTLAPYPGGTAMWGYAEGNHVLFAVDTATGRRANIWDEGADFPLRDEIASDFRPSALHYDGQWLWVGDSRGQRVVALDPLDLETGVQAEWSVGDIPTAITSVGETLWMTLGGANEVIALDKTSGDTATSCEGTTLADVGDFPNAIIAQGTTLWVVAGSQSGTLTQISAQGCNVVNAVTLEQRIDDLQILDDTLWLVSGGDIFVAPTANPNELAVQSILSDVGDNTVSRFHVQQDVLWATADGTLYVVDLAEERLIAELSVDDSVVDITSYGLQTWLSTDANEISRYVRPDYILDEAALITAIDGELWYLTTGGELCLLEGEDCSATGVTGEPLSVAAGTQSGTVWIGTDDREIVLFDTATRATLQTFTLERALPRELVDENGERLWVSDAASQQLFVADLNADTPTFTDAMNPFDPAPSHMAYNGTLYFGTDTGIVPVAYSPADGSYVVLDSGVAASSFSDFTMTAEQVIIAADGRLTVQPFNGDTATTSGIANDVTQVVVVDGVVWLFAAQSGHVFGVGG